MKHIFINDRKKMVDSSSLSLSLRGNVLPIDFVPSPSSVIIGRAKECKEASGNKRLRVIATAYLNKYSNAINRSVKSQVVSEIVDMVRKMCPQGAFIKQVGRVEDGTTMWVEASESAAREKVGYVFRDLLSDQYRSSSKSKSLSRLKRQRYDGNNDEISPLAIISLMDTPEPSTPSISQLQQLQELNQPQRFMQPQLNQPLMNHHHVNNMVEPAQIQPLDLMNFAGYDGTLSSLQPFLKRSDDFSSMNSASAAFFGNLPTTSTYRRNSLFEPTPIMHVPATRRKSELAWMEMMGSTLFD